MLHRSPAIRSAAVLAAAAGLVAAAPAAAFASAGYHGHHTFRHHGHGLTLNQVNLASDIPGLAPVTDPDLINPWGVSATSTSPLWISNQGTNSSTLYTLTPGSDTAVKTATVRVTMADSTLGPSGQVANTGTGFTESNGTTSAPAAFIFATLDGHIEAWNPTVDPLIGNAQDKVTVAGAAYTGLAIASTPGGDELFAANFAGGEVDVFNSSFQQVALAPWQFTDPRLPAGYAAFNTQALDGRIFVTYDIPDPTTGLEGTAVGNGIVDEYSTDGRLLARVATGGKLSAPWGLAIAPASWGRFAGALLVGNFGDGRITVFPRLRHGFSPIPAGQVRVAGTGQLFAEPGLWALQVGTATVGGTDAVWFTAGINGETDGLLGVLRP
jgi:uncharacterized protein (TIGR03118 family)